MKSFVRVFWKTLFRSTLRKPVLLGTSLIGIAAGTGVLCALNLANQRALRSFEISAQGLSAFTGGREAGRKVIQWRAQQGKVPVTALDACLRSLSEGIRCRGVVSGPIRTREAEIQILGVDGSWETVAAPVFSSALADAHPVLHSLAPVRGEETLQPSLIVPSREFWVMLEMEDAARWLGARPGYDWIEAAPIDEGVDFEGELRKIEARFETPLRRTTPSQMIESQKALTSTYRFNLQVLGMMSLFVGALLVANVSLLYFLIKRPVIGVLRQLGADRRDILGLVLCEQVFLGLAGGALGLLLGVWLEKAVSHQVLKTLSDLYVKTAATQAHLSWELALATVLSGALIFLASGAVSAWAATRVPPISLSKRVGQSETRTPRTPVWLTLLSLTLIAFAGNIPPMRLPWALEPASAPQPVGGYLASLAVFALAFNEAPRVFRVVASLVRRLTPSRLASRSAWVFALAVASRRARFSGVRGRAPVATLAGGLSLVIGTTLMVEGFRFSLTEWLDRAFHSEHAAEPRTVLGNENRPRLTESKLRTLRSLDFVDGVDCLLLGEGYLGDRRYKVAGIDDALPPGREAPIFPLSFPPGESARSLLKKIRENPGAALVSETYSNKFSKGPGDRIEVDLGGGGKNVASFTVLATLREYSSEAGYVLFSRDRFREITGLDGCHSLRIYSPIASPSEFSRRLEKAAPEVFQDLRVYSTRELRSNALKTFDQTFAVTGILTALAAFLGGLSLLTQILQSTAERAPEWLTLRRLGNTWFGLFRLCSMDVLLSVLSGVFLGALCGGLLGYVLCEAINRQAFGWTIAFGTPDSWVRAGAESLVFGGVLWLLGTVASLFVLKPGEKWRVTRE